MSTDNPAAIEPALERLVPRGTVAAGESTDEFLIKAELDGESAKELNRWLLSSLRRVEKRTRLRSEWVSRDGTKERFFDYVLKKKS